MTEAGWMGERPTKPGYYWWRWNTLGYSEEIVRVEVFNGEPWTKRGYRLLGGEWLGPLSPTDRQQGRVEGVREAERIARNHKGGYTLDVFTAKLIADPDGPWTLGSDIAEKLAQAAQDE